MLGMIHKKVLGLCHPSFDALLPPKDFVEEGRHSKQIYAHWNEVTAYRNLFNRSIFGMVDIYNNLPQSFVDAQTVSAFQSKLTGIAKLRCERLDSEWSSSFCRREGPECDREPSPEEGDDECLSNLPDSMTVCLSIWDDLLKKGVYQNWYHPESLMVCLRIGMTL